MTTTKVEELVEQTKVETVTEKSLAEIIDESAILNLKAKHLEEELKKDKEFIKAIARNRWNQEEKLILEGDKYNAQILYPNKVTHDLKMEDLIHILDLLRENGQVDLSDLNNILSIQFCLPVGKFEWLSESTQKGGLAKVKRFLRSRVKIQWGPDLASAISFKEK